MTKSPKVIFFGTPNFALPVLEALLDNKYNIVSVFAVHGPIEQVAKKHGIKVFSPASLKKDEQVFEEFKNLKPDICVIAAYGKIIPQKFLDVPRYGFLNIHPSLLPKYRGPSPIQTAILNGDKETGVTIMMVDAEVDHGSILKQTTYNLQSTTRYKKAEKDLAEIGAKLLVEILPKYISGKTKPQEQDHSQATFTKTFRREDSLLNWNESAENIHRKVRALNPEPGTWTIWPASPSQGGKGKVINIPTCDVGYPQVMVFESEESGRVRRVGNDIVIGTGTGYLILKSIQLEGGKVMDAKSFVNGHPEFLNSKLE